MRSQFVVVAALALTGCISTSEVVQVGKNTYRVNTTSQGVRGIDTGGELAEAARAASEYCETKGQRVIPLGADRQGAELQTGIGLERTATYKFRCADWPAYKPS